MAPMPAASASQDVARRLTDDSSAIVTGMMAPDEVERARAHPHRALRTPRTGRNSFEGFDTQRIYAQFAKTRMFDGLATDPLLLGVLDQVLGHYQLSAPVGICIGPGEKAQVLHRDDAIYRCPSLIRRWWSTPSGRSTSSPRKMAPPGSSPAATGGSRAGGRARTIR